MSTKKEFFFIASPGGCATKTIASILNRISPEIKCFHGNELPLDKRLGRSSRGELNILKQQYSFAIDNGLIIGSVHSIYTSSSRRWCHDHGGKSAVLFRNPIDRAISVLRLDDSNFLRDTKSNFGQSALTILKDIYSSNKHLSSSPDIDSIRYNFIIILLLTIKYDSINAKGFPKHEWYNYEDFTKSPAVLRSMFETVLPERLHYKLDGISMDDAPRYNYRSSGVNSDEIINKLNYKINFIDQSIRFIQSHLANIKLDIDNIYKKIGYDLFINLHSD